MVPTKGIPLPMISFGGSSLLVTLASLGILLNVAEHAG
jgi:cell division protein FtsW